MLLRKVGRWPCNVQQHLYVISVHWQPWTLLTPITIKFLFLKQGKLMAHLGFGSGLEANGCQCCLQCVRGLPLGGPCARFGHCLFRLPLLGCLLCQGHLVALLDLQDVHLAHGTDCVSHGPWKGHILPVKECTDVLLAIAKHASTFAAC